MTPADRDAAERALVLLAALEGADDRANPALLLVLLGRTMDASPVVAEAIERAVTSDRERRGSRNTVSPNEGVP